MKGCILGFLLCITSAAAFAQSEPSIETTLTSASVARFSPDVIITPNPVKDREMTLDIRNLEKGKYSIIIYNKEGKKFLLRTLNVEESSSNEAFILPEGVEPGVYILQVIGKASRLSRKLIVE